MDRTVRLKNATVWNWRENDSESATKIDGYIRENATVVVTNGWITSITYDESDTTLNECNSFGETIDAKGQLLLPGLNDSHVHVSMIGESQYFLNLSGCTSILMMKELLQKHCSEYPDIENIIGVNWDQEIMQSYPSRHDLDEVCPNKPTFLWRACWHIGVCNTLALQQAGIMPSITATSSATNAAPAVTGGLIEIDAVSGTPTGILKERAVELITNVMNKKRYEDHKKFIKEGLNLCCRNGLTSVQTNDEASYKIYQELMKAHMLPIRVFLTPSYKDLDLPYVDGGILNIHPIAANCITTDSQAMNGAESRLFADRIKIFADGSLGADTSAIRLENKYLDVADSGNSNSTAVGSYRGILIHELNELIALILKAKSRGYRVEVHAIGDEAASQVLNALEAVNIGKADRAILTHCQILGGDLVERIKSLGVICAVQPSFVPTDMSFVNERISPEQLKYSYAWKTLLTNGINVAGGSDAPIETCNPLQGMYDAIYRKSRTDDSIFRPEECLSFAEALWLYTIGASYSNQTDKISGAVKVGYIADFTLVDRKVVDDHTLLSSVTPIAVIVGGNVVYSSDDMDANSMYDVRLDGPYQRGKNGESLTAFCSLATVTTAGYCNDRCKCARIKKFFAKKR